VEHSSARSWKWRGIGRDESPLSAYASPNVRRGLVHFDDSSQFKSLASNAQCNGVALFLLFVLDDNHRYPIFVGFWGMDFGRSLRIVVVWNGLRFYPRSVTVAKCAEHRLARDCHLNNPLGNVFRASDLNGDRVWRRSLRGVRGALVSHRMGHVVPLGLLRVAKTRRGLD
jgi:hypothetical protein